MKKWGLGLALIMTSMVAAAQNFEPPKSEFTEKVEKFVGRYGQPQRHYLTDEKNKTFDARSGEKFLVVYVFDKKDKVTRKILAYQLDNSGKRVKTHSAEAGAEFRDGDKQAFGVRIAVPSDAGEVIKYKIDTNPSATVYIYKLIQGVK